MRANAQLSMPEFRDGEGGDAGPKVAFAGAVEEAPKSKWADDVEENDGEEGEEGEEGQGERTLERTETEVGADGLKQVTIFKINDHNRKVKCVQTVRVEKKQVRLPKAVIARREWAKFGKCADQPAGYHGAGFTFSGESTTSFDISEQTLDLKPKSKQLEESNKAADKAFQNAQQGTFVAWRPSARPTEQADPLAGLDPQPEGSRTTYSGSAAREWAEKQGISGSAANVAGAAGGKPGSSLEALAAGGAGSGRYVPPSMRNADGSRMDRANFQERDDSTTVRVSNISDDVSDADLRDLFRRFGSVQRVYLAKDRETGLSRGFAFITFYQREDGQAAIDKLNGHGYDHLILSVQWAAPSEKK